MAQKVSDPRFSNFVAPTPHSIFNDQSHKPKDSRFILPGGNPKNTHRKFQINNLYGNSDIDVKQIRVIKMVLNYRKTFILGRGLNKG